jgi:hypothetical protein
MALHAAARDSGNRVDRQRVAEGHTDVEAVGNRVPLLLLAFNGVGLRDEEKGP